MNTKRQIQVIVATLIALTLVSCDESRDRPIAALSIIGDGTYSSWNASVRPDPFEDLFEHGLVPPKTYTAVVRDGCKPTILFAEPKGDPRAVVQAVDAAFDPAIQRGNDHCGALERMCDLLRSERLPDGRQILVIGSDLLEDPCDCDPAPLESFDWPAELKAVELFVYGASSAIAERLSAKWKPQLDHDPRFFPPGRKPDWERDLGLEPTLGF